MVTHLELDILECETLLQKKKKKTSGGDGIPAEQFNILKCDAVKVLNSRC